MTLCTSTSASSLPTSPSTTISYAHLISSPEPHIVYFVSQQDVYWIDTRTGRRTHVAKVPFQPRCTASGYGYFCVGGGRHGLFAHIEIPHGRRNEDELNEASSLRASTSHAGTTDTTGQSDRPRMHLERLSPDHIDKHIMNSISLHRIKSWRSDELETVAVLTNNDRKVRVYSLEANLEYTVAAMAVPPNHADPFSRWQTNVGRWRQPLRLHIPADR